MVRDERNVLSNDPLTAPDLTGQMVRVNNYSPHHMIQKAAEFMILVDSKILILLLAAISSFSFSSQEIFLKTG